MSFIKIKFKSGQTYVAIAAILGAFAAQALADDSNSSQTTPPPAANAQVTGTTSTAAEQEVENKRMKALEGSKSPWSFQAQLQYSGSTINHPFAEDLPNTGGSSVAPKVTLGGTIAGRYRIDESTTAGVGTGIVTYTPFQGPKNTSVYDPQVDIAHSFKFGKIHNRADFQLLGYTDNQYGSQLGYATMITVSDESFYTFKFGLTVGLSFELDYNIFKGKAGYDPSAQTQYDLFTDPYFEYALSDKVNLRSVIGIQALGHQNDMHSAFAQYHQKIYQTFGVGVSIFEGWFIYNFVQIPDYTNVATNTLTYGFSTIIDLF
ncbi:MAG: hypothetical protein P4M08_03115 [Oligoflexia bacterium]|nr:hypothetical protein [Oligoflexia bacterium]